MPIAVTRVAADTSGGGTQDITISGIGTPKMVAILVTQATADGTATDHSNISFGMGTSASSRWALAQLDRHGLGTTDVYVATSATSIVQILSSADGSADGVADFNSWITDGVRLSWSNYPSSAHLMTVMFWYGDDIANCYVSMPLSSGTVDDYITVTPSFQIANGIFSTIRTTGLSLGFADYDGATIVQRSVCRSSRDSRPTSETIAHVSESYVATKLSASALYQGLEVTNVDSTSFRVYSRVNGSAQALGIGVWNYAAGVDHKVYTYNTPTGTGDQSDNNAGFQPSSILYFMSLLEAVDTDDLTSLSGSVGATIVTEGAQYSNAVTSEDGAGDSNTQSLSDNQAVNFPLHDGSAGMAATFVSFGSTGVTLNWSDVENAKKWIALAIEEVATGTAYIKVINETEDIDDDFVRLYNYLRSINEVEDIQESSLKAMVMARVISEVEDIVEGIIPSRTMNRIVNETEDIAEVIVRLSGLIRSINEVINISEDIVRILQSSLVKVINEVEDIQEDIARLKAMVRSISEVENLVEDTLRTMVLTRVLNETEDIGDTFVRLMAMSRVVNETEDIVEGILRILTTAGAIIKVINESENIGEVIVASRTLLRILNEAENIQENILRLLTMVRVISETEDIQENILSLKFLIKVINETEDIGEAIIKTGYLIRVLIETEDIQENVVRLESMVRVLNEIEDIQDSEVKAMTLVRILNEIEDIIDDPLRILGLVKIIDEVENIDESILDILVAFAGMLLRAIFKAMWKRTRKGMQ